jgi:hypothetical protein
LFFVLLVVWSADDEARACSLFFLFWFLVFGFWFFCSRDAAVLAALLPALLAGLEREAFEAGEALKALEAVTKACPTAVISHLARMVVQGGEGAAAAAGRLRMPGSKVKKKNGKKKKRTQIFFFSLSLSKH